MTTIQFVTKHDSVKIYDLHGLLVGYIPLAGTQIEVAQIGAGIKGVGECLQVVGYVLPRDVRVRLEPATDKELA